MEGQKRKLKKIPGHFYPESFKRKVIEEYLATGCYKQTLQRKYNIGGKSSIFTWMQDLGYADIYLKKPNVEGLNDVGLKKKFSGQANTGPQDEAALKKRITELERQLEDEKFRSEAYSLMIDMAEKELNVSIRKKTNTK